MSNEQFERMALLQKCQMLTAELLDCKRKDQHLRALNSSILSSLNQESDKQNQEVKQLKRTIQSHFSRELMERDSRIVQLQQENKRLRFEIKELRQDKYRQVCLLKQEVAALTVLLQTQRPLQSKTAPLSTVPACHSLNHSLSSKPLSELSQIQERPSIKLEISYVRPDRQFDSIQLSQIRELDQILQQLAQQQSQIRKQLKRLQSELGKTAASKQPIYNQLMNENIRIQRTVDKTKQHRQQYIEKRSISKSQFR